MIRLFRGQLIRQIPKKLLIKTAERKSMIFTPLASCLTHKSHAYLSNIEQDETLSHQGTHQIAIKKGNNSSNIMGIQNKDIKMLLEMLVDQKAKKNQNGNQNNSSFKSKVAYLVCALLGGPMCLFKSGFFMRLFDEAQQTQERNWKVKKGEEVIKEEHQKELGKSKGEGDLEMFQCKDTDQQKSIEDFYKFDDHKVVQYIEAFSGNGLATNLRRHIQRQIYKQAQKDHNIPEPDTQTTDIAEDLLHIWNKYSYTKHSEKQDKKGKKGTQLYFQDLKDLSICSKSTPSPEWGEMQKLHNLLTYLIQKGKSAQKAKILIIDNIHLLSHSFQTLNIDRINQLFKQILYINKEKIAKVVLISGNSCFYNRYLKRLQVVNLHDIKREVTQQLSDNDLKNIIRTRMAYQQVLPNIPEEKQKLDAIVQEMVDKTDCVKQLMRILKLINLDSKRYYDKCAIRSQKKPEEQLAQILKQKYKKKENFTQKLEITKRQCDKTISNIQKHIFDSVIIVEGNLDQQKTQRLKKVQKYKVEILNDIFKGKFVTEQAKNRFNMDYDDAKFQAFRELNDDEILHGFKFASKSKALAYERVLKKNPDYLSIKLYRKLQRWWTG